MKSPWCVLLREGRGPVHVALKRNAQRTVCGQRITKGSLSSFYSGPRCELCKSIFGRAW